MISSWWFNERAAGFSVLAAPFEVGETEAVAFGEEAGAAVGKGIGDGRGASGRVIVKLGARTIKVAGVEEAHEPIISAVERTADERGNVGGAQEAVARELADNNDIVVG